MILNFIICLLSFLWLLWILRAGRTSFGLPIAYLASLFLIHIPGGIAKLFDQSIFNDYALTQTGISLTAIGSVCFASGVWLAQFSTPAVLGPPINDRQRFARFCLFGGWLFVYALTPLRNIPSLGAIIDMGGAIWMLGVIVGVRAAWGVRNVASAVVWGGALLVYPVLMLLLGGFMSYGSAALIVVGSSVTIYARRYFRVVLAITLVAYLSLSLFVNYFGNRNQIRDEVWGGAPMADRLESTAAMFTDFVWFDPSDPKQQSALDQRLNQNYFVGLAAERIDHGETDYLHGRSVWEAFLALIPRAIWPDKPVGAGSGTIVAEVTGLELSTSTSWGVGNVMEFYINFGIPGVIGGFALLGYLIGWLDRKAAAVERRGDFARVPIYFLPAVALIQPNGSMVELAAGGLSAWLAGIGWRWAWRKVAAGRAPWLNWLLGRARTPGPPPRRSPPRNSYVMPRRDHRTTFSGPDGKI